MLRPNFTSCACFSSARGRRRVSKGSEVVGTLGVLDLAAGRGLVDLADSLDRLKRTNFRYRQELFRCVAEEEVPGSARRHLKWDILEELADASRLLAIGGPTLSKNHARCETG